MNTFPYSLDDLYWFVLIAEAGGISAAAREFDVAKSTLSRRLARLEAEVGIALMQRNSSASSLTDAGLHLLDELGPLFRQLEGVTGDLLAKEAMPRGLVRLSASGTFGKLALLPVISAFMQTYPEITIEMELTDRRVDVVAQGVDLAVRIGELSDSGLLARRLTSVRRVLCASAGYARQHGLPAAPEDLNAHACLLQSRASATIVLANGAWIRSLTLRGRLTLAPSDQLLLPVQMGLGISPLAEMQVAGLIASGELVRVLPEWTMPSLDVYLLSPGSRYRPPAVRLLMDYLIKNVPRHVEALTAPMRGDIFVPGS